MNGNVSNLSKNELKKFIMYLEDKIENCYKEEAKNAIEEFLKERGIEK